MERPFRDIRRAAFWRRTAAALLAALGVLAVCAQVYDVLDPGELAPRHTEVLVAAVVAASGWAVVRSYPRRVKHYFTRGRYTVEVKTGDIFDQECNVVIGMTTSFETAVPEVIAETSVQGQLLNRVYGGDVARLDHDIERALGGATSVGTGPTGRPSYAPGTVAVLLQDPKRYFCVAYSQLDSDNVAHSSVLMILLSLESLWTTVRRSSNGSPLAITAIGTGLARLANLLTVEDSVRLIILSFVLASRSQPVCDSLSVVVPASVEGEINMLELQKFLRSLSR